jgi:hypothetical protein
MMESMMAMSSEGKTGTIDLATGSTRILSVVILSVVAMTVHAAQHDEISASIHISELLGSWGIASFQNPSDRASTEAAARGWCKRPYVIGAGQSGGVIMHLADQATPQELRLKGSPSGKDYIGPPGPPAGEQDREIVWYDGRVMILRFVEKTLAARYGNMVYFRCDTGT